MDDMISLNDVKELVDLAAQYGPFFFSILFLLVISRWGNKKYTEACTRKDPVAAPDEVKTKKQYFVITTYAGLILVVVSVIWWAYFKPAPYVFSGRVEGLMEYQETYSPTLYTRSEYQKSSLVDVPLPHQEHFILTRNEPFVIGETFNIGVADKVAHSVTPFEIKFTGRNYVRYKYDADDETGEPVLKQFEQEVSAISAGEFGVVKNAYASEGYVYPLNVAPDFAENYYRQKGMATSMPYEKNHDVLSENDIDSAVAALQDEKTPVSFKIIAINALLNIDGEALALCVNHYLRTEPIVLTISDLTRHTDKVLSEKAKILFSRIDLPKFIENVEETSQLAQFELEKVILRMDQAVGSNLLKELVVRGGVSWASELQKEVGEGGKRFDSLFPTGSINGDRYYVKAEWHSDDGEVSECLTMLFNQALINNRTLEEEREIMRNRTVRYVYWYDKMWALDIADKVRRCGASASHVGF